MDESVITALATAGSGALISAMATDTWQTLRSSVQKLFKRSGARADAPTELLDRAAAELNDNAKPPEMVEASVGELRELLAGQLEELLRREPGVREELDAVIAEARRAIERPKAEETPRGIQFTYNHNGPGSASYTGTGDIHNDYRGSSGPPLSA